MKCFRDNPILRLVRAWGGLFLRTAAALLVLFASSVPVQAVDYYWDINGTIGGASGDGVTPSTTASGTWNTTNTYWNTDSTGGAGGAISAWQSGEVAVFSAGGNATGTYTVTVSGTHQIGGLRFEEGAVTLSGGILQFAGPTTFTHNGTAGDCHINSAVQGNGLLTLAGAGIWGRLNGVTSDSGGALSVEVTSGAGWVLGGQHTYTGGTTISGGYVVPTVSSTGSASAGTLTSGPFGTGTLTLTSGTLRPTSGGPITIGNAVTLNGTFTFGASDTSHNLTFTGPLTLTATQALTTTNSTVYFNGALSDGGNGYGFTKSGASALVLGGNNTFTGGVTIENGGLTLDNAGALNATGQVAVTFSNNSNAKILTLNGNSVTVAGLSNSGGSGAVVQNNAAGTATLTVNNAAANTFAGVLQNGAAGTLAVTKTGAGTLTLSGSTANTYTGLTTVTGGVLTLSKSGGATAIAGDILINGGRVSHGAANQIADTSNITVDSGVWYSSTVETINNLTINRAPTVSGYGFHLINNLNVAGTLSVSAGDVVVGSGGSAQANAVSMTGGVLSVAANGGNSTFSIHSGGLTMSGGELRLGYGGAGYTALINMAGNFTGSGTSLISTPNNSGPRLLDLGGATRTFDVTGGTTTIQPTIQNGGLTKTGAGTLALSGSNTYTGGTTVSGGILRLDANNVLADAGAVTVSGGTLDINSRTDTVGSFTLTSGNVTGTTGVLTASSYAVQSGTISAALGGTGTLTKTGAGTLTLSGARANTYTGLTTVSAGTLSLNKTAGVNAVAGDIVVNGGTLLLSANNQIADTASITVNGSGNLDGGRSQTVTNVTLNSSYNSPGTHRLSNMTITGTLTVTAGVVGLNSNSTTTANTVNMSGGRMEMAADGAPTIFDIGSGGLTMSGATLRFGWGGIGSAETAQVNLGGDFTGSGTNQFDYLTLNAPRLLDLQGATRTFNITGGVTTIAPTIQNGGLTKTGAGTLALTGGSANTYTGLTTVSAGTLSLNKTAGVNAVAGDIVVNGGTLLLAADNQIADTASITVNGSGNLDGGRSETVRNVTLNSSHSNPGAHRVSNMTITELLTITDGVVGMNSGSTTTVRELRMSGGSRMDMAADAADTVLSIQGGGLTMSGATLRFGWSGLGSAKTALVNLSGDFTGSGTNDLTYVNLSGARLLNLQGATRTFNITGGVTTIAPTIQNGGLTKTGAGTLTLTGANTYTGPTTVDAGLLLVHGTHTGGGAYTVQNTGTLGGTGTVGAAVGIGNGGTLAPGASIGTLAIDGNLAMAGGSTFEWEFNSSTLSADLLNLDGNLNLDLAGGVSLDLVDLATVGGEMEIGTKFTLISYSGDWNGGLFEDYANFSKFESGANQWRIRYDDGTGGLNFGEFDSFVTLTVVPEPSSVLLLLGVGLALLASRRRRG